MSGLKKIILKLKQGSRLTSKEVRAVLTHLEYVLERQKGSRQQLAPKGASL